MYHTFVAFSVFITVSMCASYNRYDTTDRYASSYTTISNLYDQYPFKQGYTNDIARFPNEGSRYPNYNTGYTTKSYYNSGGYNSGGYNSGGYNSGGYNSGGYNSGSLDNKYYNTGYTTPRYGDGYSSYEFPFMKNEKDYCMNRTPQNGIYVDNLMGMWFGVEYIQHLAGDSRVDYARTCIVMHISEPAEEPSTENQLYHVQHINAKFRHEYRHLRLLWDEAGRTSEYALYFRNDSAGYWQVVDGQNGTLARVQGYRQFSGSVQVLKAVNDHLLLNFCQEPMEGRPPQLYSVLFSRDPGVMPRWEINSVHTLLQNKKLSVASRRMVCGNYGEKVSYNMFFSLLSCLFAYLLGITS